MINNILYVHLFNDYSGSPAVLKDAIKVLSKNNSRKILFTSKHNGFLDEIDSDIKRYNIFYLKCNNKYLQLLFFIIAQIHLFILIFMFLLRNARCNNIIYINTLLPFGAALAGKIFSSKIIYYLHETSISPRILFLFLKSIMRLTADKQICVSKYVKSKIVPLSENSNVIYNCLRYDFFQSLLSLDMTKKFIDRNILFVGSLKKFKGIEQLRKLAKYRTEFNFYAVINCTENELEKYLKDKDRISNLTYYSRPENILEFYKNSFCVINLSLPDMWVETFGLTLLEGMALHSPVIAPTFGGPLEIVNNDCGKLINPYDINEISDFLLFLSKDYFIWKTYADSSYANSLNFTYDIYSEKLSSFHESVSN